MREHRLTPEQLAIYRERLTEGCYACRGQEYKELGSICKVEKKYKISLGFPNADKTNCRFWLRKKKG